MDLPQSRCADALLSILRAFLWYNQPVIQASFPSSRTASANLPIGRAKPSVMVWPFKKHRTEIDSKSLLRILARCRELVASSEDSDWSCMNVPDILQSLDAGLTAVSANAKPDVDELTLLFLPTGPLQETSMSNGWSDEFLTLSSEFDDLITKW